MALVRRSTTDLGTPPRGDVAHAVAALAADEPACRQRAALDLRGEPTAVPALLARVGVEPDATVREAVLTALADHDDPVVASALARHLGSDDAGLRTAVAEALTAMPHGVAPLLAALTTDTDSDVRILTVLVLADLRLPETADWLARMVAEDRHPNVVAAAVDALLPMAGSEHAGVLRLARERFPDDPFLRFTIDAALSRLAGDAGAGPRQ